MILVLTYRFIRYEDLTLNVIKVTKNIFRFLGLTFNKNVEYFIETHINTENTEAHGTERITKR